MKIATLLTVASLATLLISCKTPEEKLCPHLMKFVDKGTYSEGECTKDKEGIKKECTNPDAVFECMLSKDKEDDLKECEKKCEKKK